ncbi:MAG: hypothetical protein HYX27_02495 [Acidobacteria bacterium]|nr:hypothetical protein [Acidobacteriota bacterium]
MRRLLLPREWSPLRYAELWQDGEELLYIHSSRFSDRYARYRFRDIQAFVLTEFPLWNSWRAWWLGISFFFAVVLLLAPPGWWKLFAIMPGVFLLWALVYLLRGPRCRLVLHTAVSTVTLEAVCTIAQARAVLPELRRLTEAMQGRLAPDGLTVVTLPPAPEAPAPAHNTPLLMHVLFGMLVMHALILAGFYSGNKLDSGLGLSGTLLLAELVMGFLAALRWRSIGPLMTIVSAMVVLFCLADSGVLIYSTVNSLGGFFTAVSQRGAKPEDIEWLWLKEQSVGRAAWHAVAGLVGWVLLMASRGSRP